MKSCWRPGRTQTQDPGPRTHSQTQTQTQTKTQTQQTQLPEIIPWACLTYRNNLDSSCEMPFWSGFWLLGQTQIQQFQSDHLPVRRRTCLQTVSVNVPFIPPCCPTFPMRRRPQNGSAELAKRKRFHSVHRYIMFPSCLGRALECFLPFSKNQSLVPKSQNGTNVSL